MQLQEKVERLGSGIGYGGWTGGQVCGPSASSFWEFTQDSVYPSCYHVFLHMIVVMDKGIRVLGTGCLGREAGVEGNSAHQGSLTGTSQRRRFVRAYEYLLDYHRLQQKWTPRSNAFAMRRRRRQRCKNQMTGNGLGSGPPSTNTLVLNC